MQRKNLFEEVKQLVSINDIDNSLVLLKKHFKEKKIENIVNDIILITAQFNQLRENYERGLIDSIEGVSLNKIRHNILSILDKHLHETPQKNNHKSIYLSKKPYLDMDNVIGREEELNEILKIIGSKKNIVINGFGGIGKTTVAKAFLKKHDNKFKYIIWIEFTQELISDFFNQIEHEQIGFSHNGELHPERNFKLLMEKLDDLGLESENLIVIDNISKAEDVTNNFKFFPHSWKLLITSRVKIPNLIEYKLNTLDISEAKLLFYKHYKKEHDDESLSRLIAMAGYHTLTIELLAKTAEESIHLDIKKTCNLFNREKINSEEYKRINISILKDKEVIESQMYNYLLSIYNTSNLTEQEKWVLSQFCILPAIAIDGNEIYELLSLNLGINSYYSIDIFELSNVLQKLVQKGWIEKNNSSFQIHPVIQEVLRVKLKPDFLSCNILVNSILTKLKAIKGYYSQPKILYEQPYSRHILYAKEMLFFLFQKENIVLAELCHLVSLMLKEMYLLKDALFFELKCLDMIPESIVHSNLKLDGIEHLGIIHRELGDYEKAELYFLESIREASDKFPDDKIRLLNIYREASINYKYFGKLQLGLQLVEDGLKIIDSLAINEKHVFFQKGMFYNDACAILFDLGMWDKALDLLQIAKQIWKNLSPDSHESSSTYNNIASVYIAKTDFIKALEYQKKSITIMENIATEEHPVLAHKYSKLSIILRSLGEIDEALEIQTKVLDLREKIFGKSHVNYAHSCNFLSLIYLDKKDFVNAILYQDIALNIRLSQQSEYSFELAESYYNYALIMKEMGNLGKSIEYVQKSIIIYQHNNHPNLKGANNLLHTISQSFVK